MDENVLRLWVCHYLPIWVGAIYQHRKVLPEDLLALSLLPWYPQQQGCFCFVFFLRSNVFLGTRAVSDSVNVLWSAALTWSQWRELRLLLLSQPSRKILLGIKKDRRDRERSDKKKKKNTDEKEDTTAVWKVGWTSGSRVILHCKISDE